MESKKVILVATASDHKANWFEKAISGHVSGATIFRAHEGLEAWNKLQNVPPHMVICDMDLPKLAGVKLVGQAVARKGSDSMSFLLIGQLPQN
jgi:YesN/AraC family two-component response regulator